MVTAFRGRIIAPSDADYDTARTVFNGVIDRKPEQIMRCVDAADVATAIREARAAGRPISVYGGGQGVTGSAVIDAGMCIDLRDIDHVVVDAEARTARVGGGATWGKVDAATQEHGRALTGGRVSSTGVGGLTLGSGSGWLERSLGFTCDSIVSTQVVTADGGIVTASDEENPDLFWALRGGGGNFGVVTEFTFRLHPVGPVVGGLLVYPVEAGAHVFPMFRELMANAPDELVLFAQVFRSDVSEKDGTVVSVAYFG